MVQHCTCYILHLLVLFVVVSIFIVVNTSVVMRHVLVDVREIMSFSTDETEMLPALAFDVVTSVSLRQSRKFSYDPGQRSVQTTYLFDHDAALRTGDNS